MERINISNDIKQLTGNGTEYLIDIFGNVIAKFFDGNLVIDAEPAGDNEVTAVAA